MSQAYYPQYGNNNQEYIESLVSKEVKKYSEQGKVQNAMYNPRTGFIHVTSENVDAVSNEMWNNWAKVANYDEYKRLKALNASGQKSTDSAAYNYIMPEFQDQALRYYESYKAKGAAVITSTEFPQITVTQVSQALLNRQNLVAQKYNLNGIPEKLTVSDTINIVYPEYNNTTQTVRVGYKENEAIDTSGYGSFTQTNVTLKKAGAGMAFTEEYYMRQFTMDIQALILEKIALDFVAARYNRIIAKLPGLTDLAGADWAAYTAGNLQSTNRPLNDLNAAWVAVMADKLANLDTIITNQQQFIDFYTNTWVKGLFNQDTATQTPLNGIINNPPGIPWASQWIVNEDIAANKAYVFDHRFIIDIEGPRKTQQIQTFNPDQTVFIQKEWFDIVVPSLRTGWGRELTGL
jgi:hypothetical protein